MTLSLLAQAGQPRAVKEGLSQALAAVRKSPRTLGHGTPRNISRRGQRRGQTGMALKLGRCFSAVVFPVAVAVLTISKEAPRSG